MGSLELARRHLAECGPADANRQAAKRAYPYAPTFVGQYFGRLLRARAREHNQAGRCDEASDAEWLGPGLRARTQRPGRRKPEVPRAYRRDSSRAFELAASEATALVAVGATGPAAWLLDVLWEGKAVWATTLVGAIGSPGDIANGMSTRPGRPPWAS